MLQATVEVVRARIRTEKKPVKHLKDPKTLANKKYAKGLLTESMATAVVQAEVCVSVSVFISSLLLFLSRALDDLLSLSLSLWTVSLSKRERKRPSLSKRLAQSVC